MKLRKCFEFTGEELFFQGHFPEAPVLPGVVQLEFAVKTAEEMIGHPLQLKAIKKMKFMKIVTPQDRVEVEVEGEGSEIMYQIWRGAEICSSGVLVF